MSRKKVIGIVSSFLIIAIGICGMFVMANKTNSSSYESKPRLKLVRNMLLQKKMVLK